MHAGDLLPVAVALHTHLLVAKLYDIDPSVHCCVQQLDVGIQILRGACTNIVRRNVHQKWHFLHQLYHRHL